MAGVGIAFCDCGGPPRTDDEIRRIRQSVTSEASGVTCLHSRALCGPDGLRALGAELKERGLSRLVIAGCRGVAAARVAQQVATGTGLSPAAVVPVDLRAAAAGAPGLDVLARRSADSVARAARALALIPDFDVATVELRQEVLVLGGGVAGRLVADEIAELGYATVLLEPEDGEAVGSGPTANGKPIVLRGDVVSLDGDVGSFCARIRAKSDTRQVECGAVVIAGEATGDDPDTKGGAASALSINRVLTFDDVAAVIRRMPPKKGHQSVALLLDLEREETTAGTRAALQLAIEIRSGGRLQCYLLCRDVQVAATGMQQLYDTARAAGAVVVKYDGQPTLEDTDRGVVVRCTDVLMQRPFEICCGLVGVSTLGLARRQAPLPGGSASGIGRDAYGQVQQNNPRLFPERTDRPGIFVAGPARGIHDVGRLRVDARAAALAVHELLAPRRLRVELSQPIVDADKCALCLTCVRACPYGAMRVDREKRAAFSVAHVCQRCGTCVGECPARAITLPAWPEALLLAGTMPARSVAAAGA